MEILGDGGWYIAVSDLMWNEYRGTAKSGLEG